MGLATSFALLSGAGAVSFITWPRPIDIGRVPTTNPVPAVALSAAASRVPSTHRSTAKHPTLVPLVSTTSGPLSPERLLIPSLGVDARVADVTVSPSGALGVPTNPKVVGWWRGGPDPGSVRGTAVIDGHVDTVAKAGALFHVDQLRPGDQLGVVGSTGVLAFQVDAVRQYAKATLPARQVFDRAVAGRLVLVTCGGHFDQARHSYDDNLVVYATALPGAG